VCIQTPELQPHPIADCWSFQVILDLHQLSGTIFAFVLEQPFPIMRTANLDIRLASSHDAIAAEFFDHSTAKRVNTDALLIQAIKEQYPNKHVTIAPEFGCDLLGYAAAGHALAMPVPDTDDSLLLKWRSYVPPSKRLDGGIGGLVDKIIFGKYQYAWKDQEFVLYLIDGRDGTMAYPITRNNYIIGDEAAVNDLILEVGKFSSTLHDEIWVFNQGFWHKDAELWKSISHASWNDVILDAQMKRTLIDDVSRFFDSRLTYSNLKVPWKRGIIFHGPPGMQRPHTAL
jgi:transitional endoplasmic reticulum ATPase